ncbi:MAG TPA: extracellular solute-binding protein [Lachnospiraceae bacterium]|nr:extracellular solute-binding protein [Lachnospiraceae bacterium]
MRRKIWLAIIFICLLILTGCSHKTESVESSAVPEYNESSQIFRLPEEHYPFTLMGMSDTHFYYYHGEIVNSEKENIEDMGIYMQAMERGSKSIRLKLPSENIILRSSYITTDSFGKDRIYLLLGEETEGKLHYSLAGYDTEGTFLEEVSLQNTGLPGDYPNAFLKLQDGNFAVITKKYFFVADSNGETLFSIPCPGAEYRGLVEISEEKIGVSYVESDETTVCLSIVDRNTGVMSGGNPITGDGNCLYKNQEAIAYVDEEGIYKYDLIEKDTSKVVELEGRNIDIHQIVDMRITEEDTFHLFGYSTDVTAVKYITYTRIMGKELVDGKEPLKLDETKYDAYGRRYIYLYDYLGDWPKDSTNPVDAFNEQSDTYQVVFKDYKYAHSYDDTYDVAKIVASGDYPDLIFSTYNSLIADFNEKGVLEDLTPYINNSENLSLDDLSESILTAYTDQGRLFALPNRYTLSAFYGSRMKLGTTGWTVDEFLDWMKENPNTFGMVSTRKQIYDACIPTIMEMCIDRETGKATFNGEIFQSFITKVKALNRKDSYTYEEMTELKEKEDAYGLLYSINLNIIAVEENKQGRELVIKGYPSADGKPVAYIISPALSILSTSEVKEGAYEFLEFYLLYMSDIIFRGMHQGVSGLWTVDRYEEQNIEALLQADNYMGEPCTFSKSQLDEVLDIIPYAVLADYSQDDLRELIWEELKPFFENQKDAESVCNIIQSRVQLYLDEKNIK